VTLVFLTLLFFFYISLFFYRKYSSLKDEYTQELQRNKLLAFENDGLKKSITLSQTPKLAPRMMENLSTTDGGEFLQLHN
jgi:hypothetical protein